METLIQTALDADGVLLATIDMPGRTMNVFSAGLMDALDALMNRVDSDPTVRSVVLTRVRPAARVTQPWSIPIGMAERPKPTEAMLEKSEPGA